MAPILTNYLGQGMVQELAVVRKNDNGERKLDVLPRNVCHSHLNITEPQASDEFSGNKEAYMAAVFADCRQTWLESMKYHLGYHLDVNFDYGALSLLLPFPINNFGDPFVESKYGVNSKNFEVAVLDWFASLWEIDKDEYWGYITTGSTEANLRSILLGSMNN